MAPISTVYVMQDQITSLEKEKQTADTRISKLEQENQELKAKLELLMTKVGL